MGGGILFSGSAGDFANTWVGLVSIITSSSFLCIVVVVVSRLHIPPLPHYTSQIQKEFFFYGVRSPSPNVEVNHI